MNKPPKKDFVFRKHMSVGEADAENDDFLADCFVDIGDYDVIEDTDASQSIVLGRTGVGKSALLERMEAENGSKVIRIEPEQLALRHVSNSTILNFFEDLGVSLDIFYRLLWQHTLAVELIKFRYSIDSAQAKSNFLDTIKRVISTDQKKQQALKYIEEWGDKFWVDTETRIKEFTDKLEASLQTAVSSNVPGVKVSGQSSANLTEEQRFEVLHHGKKVVSKVQIEKLAKIIDLLSDDVFDDPQKKVYILIDRLDEDWVEDSLRYKLIRALIETVRKFRVIKPVKIVFTLRTDLLERVLEKTRDSGFQREKYNSLFLPIGWKKRQLEQLLDSRMNRLLKHKYTNSDVKFSDVFPAKIDKLQSIDYMLDRTLLRPRDAIVFVNECLREAQGKAEISTSDITHAEKTYSLGRLESLKYEWYVEHPHLDRYLALLHGREASFKASAFNEEILTNLAVELSEFHEAPDQDSCVQSSKVFIDSDFSHSRTPLIQFRQEVLYTLYKVGAIGIKVDGTSSVRWIHDRTQDLTPRKIEQTSIIYIHKMLWRALAVDKRG